MTRPKATTMQRGSMFKFIPSGAVALGTVLLSTVLLSTVALAASGDALLAQGQWAAAVRQATAENDLLTAAVALHFLQECPSPAQPQGEAWDSRLSGQAAGFARQLLKGKLNRADTLQAYLTLGDTSGNQAQVTANLIEKLRLARESRSAYESAVKFAPDDGLAQASLAVYYSLGAKNGGAVVGLTRSEAQSLTRRAALTFNQMPDGTRDQQLRKAWTAIRLGGAYEGLGDKQRLPVYEAAIKLGESSKTASGQCAANVARVHLNRPISTF